MRQGKYRLIHGNVTSELHDLEAKSVQVIFTSPPYWSLRDYGVEGQIGMEELHDCMGWATGNPCGECYVCHMTQVFRLCRRVLRDDGTLWLNLGDSYSGSGGAGGDYADHGLRSGQPTYEGTGKKNIRTTRQSYRRDKADVSVRVPGVLKPKDLVGIPWRVALALQADGWYLRSDIIWSKPNPMPESVKDRPTKSHEYIFLFSKSREYYYDQDAIREPYAEASLPRALRGLSADNKWTTGAPGSTAHTMSQARPNMRKKFAAGQAGGGSGLSGHSGYVDANGRLLVNPMGRNKWTVWNVPTQAYSEAHFATFPEALPEIGIKAGSREGDVVLDPFNGSGTTGAVAVRLGRDYVGIDLNEEYLELAKKRIGKEVLPMLEMIGDANGK